jgi:hypothetical protein
VGSSPNIASDVFGRTRSGVVKDGELQVDVVPVDWIEF